MKTMYKLYIYCTVCTIYTTMESYICVDNCQENKNQDHYKNQFSLNNCSTLKIFEIIEFYTTCILGINKLSGHVTYCDWQTNKRKTGEFVKGSLNMWNSHFCYPDDWLIFMVDTGKKENQYQPYSKVYLIKSFRIRVNHKKSRRSNFLRMKIYMWDSQVTLF